MTLIGPRKGLRHCRCCGCDDNHACEIPAGGPYTVKCEWVLLDITRPTGICSACAEAYGWHPLLFVGEFDGELAEAS